MLEFDLILCLVIIFVVAYFETKGITLASKNGNVLIGKVNKILIGNKKLYALPVFMFLSIIDDLENQINVKPTITVLLYFLIFIVLLFTFYFKFSQFGFFNYINKVKYIYNQYIKLTKVDNSEHIKISHLDLKFFLNEILLTWLFIFSFAIVCSKGIYYLTI